MTTYIPRNATHTVRCAVTDTDPVPVPYAEPGTTMIVTRIDVVWFRMGTDPWRLDVVTEGGAASNGAHVEVDYYPNNPSKKPPARLSAWVASTHPNAAQEASKS